MCRFKIVARLAYYLSRRRRDKSYWCVLFLIVFGSPKFIYELRGIETFHCRFRLEPKVLRTNACAFHDFNSNFIAMICSPWHDAIGD